MARIWSSGFESNANPQFEWTAGAAGSATLGTIQSTVKRSGTYAFQVQNPTSQTAAGQAFQFLSAAGNGPYYLRVYLRADTLPNATTSVIGFGSVNSNAGYAPVIKMNSSGQLGLFYATTQVGSWSSALTTTQWYRVEFMFNHTTNAMELLIDGTSIASGTGLSISSGVFWIAVGANLRGSGETNTSGNLYFDDIAINDSSGSDQTSYPGPGSIIHLRPNATGDNNAWGTGAGGTAGAANNYTRVAEVPFDDLTSYNTSATLNNIDDYNIDDTPAALGSSDVVNLVAVGVRYKVSTATSPPSFVVRYKSAASGTVSEGTAITSNNSSSFTTNANAAPKVYTLTKYTTPDGNAITKSNLDTSQIGVRTSAQPSSRVNQVTAVWLLVESIPTTTTTQTQSGVTNIAAGNTTTTQTQTGKGDIQKSISQTQGGKGDIQKSTTQTQTGTSRVTGSGSQTQSGLSRVTATSTKTQTGKGDIRNSTTQTQTGTGRVTNTSTQTQSGVGRVSISSTQTTTGKARVTATTTKTQSGVTDIRNTTTQTTTGKSRVTISASQTQSGTSIVTATTSRTQSGIADVRQTTSQTTTGLSRVTATSSQTQTGKGSVVNTSSQTQTGASRVTATSTQTQTGQADIRTTTTRTQDGKTRIQINSSQTQTGSSRVTTSTAQTTTGKARVTITTSQPQTGTGRVTQTTSRTQSGTAAIQNGTNQTQTGTGRVTVTNSQTQTGKGRVTISSSQTQSGIGRVGLVSSQTQDGKGRITTSATQTQSGIADVRQATSQTQTGAARLTQTTSQTQGGTSSISGANLVSSQTQGGKTRIQKAVPRTQGGKASILSTVSQPRPKLIFVDGQPALQLAGNQYLKL